MTTLWTAHRLSTIVNVDSICLLHEGSLLATGTHSELLNSSPVYKDLWNQFINKKEDSKIVSQDPAKILEAEAALKNDNEKISFENKIIQRDIANLNKKGCACK